MLKSRKQKFIAPLMGLFVTDVVSVTITRFAPWCESYSEPSIKRGLYGKENIVVNIKCPARLWTGGGPCSG